MTPARASLAALASLAACLLLLAGGVPDETFAVGDSGVKLVAARNALERPRTPFEIPLPSIDGQPADFVEPFFVPHGTHSHAVTSELFPLASAPFIGWFGTRGASVLPAAGFLAGVLGCALIATALDPRRSPLLAGGVAVFATPWLFYGLEFWEHAPAVGALALGTALLLRVPRARPAAIHLAAGVLYGIAVLFRPEAIWFALAVLGCAPLLLPGRVTRATALRVVIGMALAAAPLMAYSLTHFGSLTGIHVAANLGPLGHHWLADRLAFAAAWFVVPSAVNLWWAVPSLVLGALATPWAPAYEGRRFLVAVAVTFTLLVMLTAPNDGGAQWGPRYLLPAYLPLVVLVADGLQGTRQKGWIGIAVVAAVLLAGAWNQRTAYRELRGAKRTYGKVLTFVREAPSAGAIVTDLWWLDQVAAAARDRRQFYFVADGERAAVLAERLCRGGAGAVTVVRSREESGPTLDGWVPACLAPSNRREIEVRQLTAVDLARREP